MEELGLGDVDDIEGKIQRLIITDRAVSACIKTESCVKHSKTPTLINVPVLGKNSSSTVLQFIYSPQL